MNANKIINIRGTYGSGKTTLARFVMDNYLNKEPHFVKGRKKPLYYTFEHPNGGNPLAVVGSYETVCGGCDTLATPNMVFETVGYLQEYCDVFYESLLLTADCNRTIQNYQGGWNLHVIYLDVPVEICIQSVNQRRRAKDPHALGVNPKNLIEKIKSCKSSFANLSRNGVPTYLLDRAAAYDKCLEILEVESIL